MRFVPTPLQSNHGTQNITGKVWADGRCGWSAVRQKDTCGLEDIASAVVSAKSDGRAGGMDYRIEKPTLSHVEKHLPSLGSSSVPNSHKEGKRRSLRGRRGLTSHGKKMVFNGCDYLQWRYGKQHLSFGTVTIPSVSEEEGWRVVEEWAEIVRTFIQRIRRKLHGKGLPDWVVGATEIQGRRWCEGGFPPLHLHFVCVGRHPKRGWAMSPRTVREAWRSAIVSRVPSLRDCDYSACENLQQVRQSAGNYLSKYVSKGLGIVGDVELSADRRCPSSWYTITRSLGRLIRGVTRHGTRIGAILSGLDDSAFVFKRRIEAVDSNGLPFTVGWAALLKKGWEALIGIPTYRPPDEYLYLQSRWRIPRVHHDGFSYLFSNHCSVVKSDCSSVPCSVAVSISL